MNDSNNSNSGGGDKKKKGRRYGENRAFIIGHVVEEPKTVPGKFVTVPVMIPSYVKDGKRQWVRVAVDVFGDDMAKAAKAKVGELFRATCHLIPRKVKDDNGDTRTLMRLQANRDDGIGISSLSTPVTDAKNPPDLGICRNEVVFLGTYIGDKDRRGDEGPKVRGDDGKKMTFVRLVYNDPKKVDEEDNGEIWIDVALFGKTAENAGEHLRHMSVVYVSGEIGVREAKFTVNGKTPNDLRISPRPYGFQYFKPGAGTSERKEATTSGPDASAYDDDGGDLPF
jgi:single-stranded DNA-binding protein